MAAIENKLLCEKCVYFITKERYQTAANHRMPSRGSAPCSTCARFGHAAGECWKTKICSTCGKSGHVKERCLSDYHCELCGLPGHTEDYCRTILCKRCGGLGHTEDECHTKLCEHCGERDHYATHCSKKQCDKCGLFGHDGEHCRMHYCAPCNRYHSADFCPSRCLTCGATDCNERCLVEVCTRCGMQHAVQHCPYSACQLCAIFPDSADLNQHLVTACPIIDELCHICYLSTQKDDAWATHDLSHCTHRLLMICRVCRRRGHPAKFCSVWPLVRRQLPLVDQTDRLFQHVQLF